MRQITVLILGDHDTEFHPHAATRDAVHHAAEQAGVIVNTRWLGADDLQLYPGLVAEAAAVVLAPPGPRSPRILPLPTLQSLTLVRSRDLPFLATGESHAFVIIELAREVLGLKDATSTRFDEDAAQPVVSAVSQRHEAAAPLHPFTLEILEGTPLTSLYGGPGRYPESTDLCYGLNPDYAHVILQSGFRIAGVDPLGGRPYLHFIDGRRFHVTASFLPQMKSRRSAPHPLFRGLIAAGLAAN